MGNKKGINAFTPAAREYISNKSNWPDGIDWAVQTEYGRVLFCPLKPTCGFVQWHLSITFDKATTATEKMGANPSWHDAIVSRYELFPLQHAAPAEGTVLSTILTFDFETYNKVEKPPFPALDSRPGVFIAHYVDSPSFGIKNYQVLSPERMLERIKSWGRDEHPHVTFNAIKQEEMQVGGISYYFKFDLGNE